EERGQWGITQDNTGRLFYNFNWSQLHYDAVPPNLLSRNPHFEPTLAANLAATRDQRVYPIRMNTAVNRGYREGVLDEQGRLVEFASACSPWIYRGGAFPETHRGNAFVCAPGANTIKRNLITQNDLTVMAENGYPDRDFLASDDERFRPVALSGGPDGALYVVDMYRGIIQQAEFMTSYLKEDSRNRKLGSPIHLGRIYRITARDGSPSDQPDLSTASGAIAALRHKNGWWRDRAQQALVFHKPGGVAEELEQLVREPDPITALHALWTLEGMDELAVDFLVGLTSDSRDVVATAAMRLIAVRDDLSLQQQELAISRISEAGKKDPVRGLHAILALSEWESTAEKVLFLAAMHAEDPIAREAVVSGLAKDSVAFLDLLLEHPQWRETTTGREILAGMVAGVALRSVGGDREKLGQFSEEVPWLSRSIESGFAAAAVEFSEVKAEQGEVRSLNEREKRQFSRGHSLYASLCSSCHAVDGKGIRPLAPPLVDSEWVVGDPDRLARILLHGLEGPIDVRGRRYAPPDILPAMPPVGMMSDGEIAAVMTYVRRAWGHSAEPVASRDVGRVRGLHYTREHAWTVSELRNETASVP
ncbi:MAG: c-type cytochrome, partial [Verrucomicrobiota bacterium]